MCMPAGTAGSGDGGGEGAAPATPHNFPGLHAEPAFARSEIHAAPDERPGGGGEAAGQLEAGQPSGNGRHVNSGPRRVSSMPAP